MDMGPVSHGVSVYPFSSLRWHQILLLGDKANVYVQIARVTQCSMQLEMNRRSPIASPTPQPLRHRRVLILLFNNSTYNRMISILYTTAINAISKYSLQAYIKQEKSGNPEI